MVVEIEGLGTLCIDVAYNAFVNIEMYQFVRVMMEDSIKHGVVVLKDTMKLFSLVSGKMCTIVCNFTNVGRMIIRSQDARF